MIAFLFILIMAIAFLAPVCGGKSPQPLGIVLFFICCAFIGLALN
jgi:hypothetical protein